MFYLREDSPKWVVDYYNSREFLTSHLHWSKKSNYAADHSGKDAWRRYSNRLNKEADSLTAVQVEEIKNLVRR